MKFARDGLGFCVAAMALIALITSCGEIGGDDPDLDQIMKIYAAPGEIRANGADTSLIIVEAAERAEKVELTTDGGRFLFGGTTVTTIVLNVKGTHEGEARLQSSTVPTGATIKARIEFDESDDKTRYVFVPFLPVLPDLLYFVGGDVPRTTARNAPFPIKVAALREGDSVSDGNMVSFTYAAAGDTCEFTGDPNDAPTINGVATVTLTSGATCDVLITATAEGDSASAPVTTNHPLHVYFRN